jgi:HAMP domain-containing protein
MTGNNSTAEISEKQRLTRNATISAILLGSVGLLSVVGIAISYTPTVWYEYVLLANSVLLATLGFGSLPFLLRGHIKLGTGLLFVANLLLPFLAAVIQTDFGLIAVFYTVISSSLLILTTLPVDSRKWSMGLTTVVLIATATIDFIDPAYQVEPIPESVGFVIIVTVVLAVAFTLLTGRRTWERGEINVRMAGWTALVLTISGILFSGFGISMMLRGIFEVQLIIPMVFTVLLVVAGIFSLLSTRRGYERGYLAQGVSILFIINLLPAISAGILIENMGYIVAAYILVASTFMIFEVLPTQSRLWGGIITIIAIGIVIAAAWLGMPFQMNMPEAITFTPFALGFMLIVFLVLVMRRAVAGNIRTRLVIAFILVGVLPFVVAGFLLNEINNRLLTDDAFAELEKAAIIKEHSINEWAETMGETLAIILSRSRELEVAEAITGDPSLETELQINSIQRDFAGFLLSNDTFEEFFILDLEGRVVLSTDDEQVGKLFANQAFFQEGLEAAYIQPPLYSPSLKKTSVVAAHPISDGAREVVGVLAGRANLNALDAIMLPGSELGETEETYLVLSNFSLLTASRFDGYPVTETYFRTEGLIQAFGSKQNGLATYLGYRGTQVMGAYRWLPDLEVVLMAEVEQSEALRTLRSSANINIVVAVSGAIVAALASFWVSRSIADPVRVLAASAERIGAGDLDVQVEVERSDEIGTLGAVFNDMAAQLKQTLAGLEQQVEVRTRALATSTEVSRRLSTILDQEQLVHEVVEQLQNAFGFYHAQIYLYDEDQRNLVMAGGTGDAGAKMLADGHSLPLGKGLVGQSAELNTIIRHTTDSKMTGWLPNPLLPETKVELAVPIAIGSEVLGVLDVQHNISDGLTQEDADLIQAISSQVGIALQNAQLYTRAQHQAEHEATVASIGQRIQGSISVDDALQIAISELGQALGAKLSQVELSLPQKYSD